MSVVRRLRFGPVVLIHQREEDLRARPGLAGVAFPLVWEAEPAGDDPVPPLLPDATTPAVDPENDVVATAVPEEAALATEVVVTVGSEGVESGAPVGTGGGDGGLTCGGGWGVVGSEGVGTGMGTGTLTVTVGTGGIGTPTASACAAAMPPASSTLKAAAALMSQQLISQGFGCGRIC